MTKLAHLKRRGKKEKKNQDLGKIRITSKCVVIIVVITNSITRNEVQQLLYTFIKH